jgi:hypothetical protein
VKVQDEFHLYDHAQQANSLKMVVNLLVAAVNAHVVKGRAEGKADVEEYPGKVIRQMEL